MRKPSVSTLLFALGLSLLLLVACVSVDMKKSHHRDSRWASGWYPVQLGKQMDVDLKEYKIIVRHRKIPGGVVLCQLEVVKMVEDPTEIFVDPMTARFTY